MAGNKRRQKKAASAASSTRTDHNNKGNPKHGIPSWQLETGHLNETGTGHARKGTKGNRPNRGKKYKRSGGKKGR